ncbi:MAG: helix-turn-helix transcriptional regulator [Gammaproteobacteria bacterium]|nr:helix-turn-helix transcriptional regulator [Gammaproteobacteria bacterium]
MSTLSDFGKALRKMRIDKDMTLKDLSDRLEVTPAYLSAVETGRKPVNAQLINNITQHMSLSTGEAHSLTLAASKSRPDVTLRPKSDFESEVALMFARRLEGSSTFAERIHQALKEEL